MFKKPLDLLAYGFAVDLRIEERHMRLASLECALHNPPALIDGLGQRHRIDFAIVFLGDHHRFWTFYAVRRLNATVVLGAHAKIFRHVFDPAIGEPDTAVHEP